MNNAVENYKKTVSVGTRASQSLYCTILESHLWHPAFMDIVMSARSGTTARISAAAACFSSHLELPGIVAFTLSRPLDHDDSRPLSLSRFYHVAFSGSAIVRIVCAVATPGTSVSGSRRSQGGLKLPGLDLLLMRRPTSSPNCLCSTLERCSLQQHAAHRRDMGGS